MAEQTTQREIIELKPGVSLDGVVEGVILIEGTIRKLVVPPKESAGTDVICTIYPTQNGRMKRIVMAHRRKEDYDPNTGKFSNMGTEDGYVIGISGPYERCSKMLKEAGE